MEKETALKILREHRDRMPSVERTALEVFVPELKESEDERNNKIKREIVDMLYYYHAKSSCFIPPQFSLKETLAWLEKQGNNTTISPEAMSKSIGISTAMSLINYLDDNRYEGAMDMSSIECEDLEKSILDLNWGKVYGYMRKQLEKQGEQPQDKSALEVWKDMRLEVYQQASGNRHEPNYSDDSTKMFSLTDIDEIFEKIAEKQDKKPTDEEMKAVLQTEYEKGRADVIAEMQKSVNKVEPKFKVGDTMRTLQEASNGITDGIPVVVSIDEKYYYCNNEIISIKGQDNYEYPPMNRVQKPFDYENATIAPKDFAPKEEPKFKSGTYVVYLNNTYMLEDDGKHYILTAVKKNTSIPVVHLPYGNEDYTMSKWTIQDAKNGDVLVTLPSNGSNQSKRIFIFKEITDGRYIKNSIDYYCELFNNKFMVKSEFAYMGDTIDDFAPATREQCDLLFQMMREAGYEWDAEKKELKIIDWSKHIKSEPNSHSITEEKSANKVEPKFKVGDLIVNEYCMGRVVEVTDDAYLLDTGQGIPFSCNSTRLLDINKDTKE